MDLMLWAIPIAIFPHGFIMSYLNGIIIHKIPGEIIAIWKGGLAIHGALIGAVITAYCIYEKKKCFLLAGSRYCSTKYYTRASDWKMGKFYESGSTWWRSDPCIP